MKKVDFQQVKLAGYTGVKSSPYTEGALVWAEKPGLSRSREAAGPIQEPLRVKPDPLAPSEPGGS